jgi:predicted ester cyclase
MTHRGEGLGVKATGNEVRVTGMSIARVDGGKIVEGWNEWDRMKLGSANGLIIKSA